jgi:putative oxidoreductase
MKIAALIARILLGLIFFVFGLNGFLFFIPMGPPPAGLAGQFVGALFQSHYLVVVSGIQVIGGALLLVNRYVPLALVILGPVIVNILLFHIFLEPKGLAIAVLVALLWVIVAISARRYLSGIFAQRMEDSGPAPKN